MIEQKVYDLAESIYADSAGQAGHDKRVQQLAQRIFRVIAETIPAPAPKITSAPTLPNLSRYRCVIVTGPQRAGTRICARMIAHDTGLRYIDEENYGTKDLKAWKALITNEAGIVIHSPAMARWVHEVGRKDTCIVWMTRPVNEIVASQVRVGWAEEAEEKAKYRDVLPSSILEMAVAEVKLHYWRMVQRPNVVNWYEVAYKDLAAHSLWVDKRSEFGARQWKISHQPEATE